MAALQCEICGGKLIGRPGGIFECDSCGMEYDTAWAKAKIQEIKGTVKVEGTVEVTGTVKVEGAATKEDFVQRGQEALEVEQWNRAKDLFNQALDMAPRYTVANLGLEMTAFHCKDIKTLAMHHANGDIRYFDVKYNDYMRKRLEERACRKEFDKIKDIAKSLGDAWVVEYEAIFNEEFARIEAAKEAEAKAQEEARIAKELEEQKRLEYEQKAYEERQRQLQKSLPKLRARAAKAKGLISVNENLIAVSNESKVLTTAYEFQLALLEAKSWQDIVSISEDNCGAMGLRSDGTVIVSGSELKKHIDYYQWKDLIHINVGYMNAIGIKADGTVICAGENKYGQCDVREWTDIVDVYTGDFSLGLKSDGTVVACGLNKYGACNVSEWSDIVAISHGAGHSVGLKSDGTVVAAGNNAYERCNVSDWKNIVSIATGGLHTVGLKADGTVVATGSNTFGECNVEKWRNIVAIFAGDNYTIGLKAGGTIVSTSTDQSKGSASWKLFDHIDNLENVQEKLKKTIIERQEQQRQWRSQEVCQHCGAPFKKGLFGKRCSQCWEPKDY